MKIFKCSPINDRDTDPVQSIHEKRRQLVSGDRRVLIGAFQISCNQKFPNTVSKIRRENDVENKIFMDISEPIFRRLNRQTKINDYISWTVEALEVGSEVGPCFCNFFNVLIANRMDMQFPNLFRRYVASLIDVIVVIALVGFISTLPITDSKNISGITIFIVVIAVYEPILTVFSCTIGQLVMCIRVRSSQDQVRIGFIRALFRTFVKYCLGIISFLSMPAQRERRAMHDLVAGTLVLNAKDAK
ncbi:putative RDD family membrane protein YckC [Oxalobacteraceae bacterium GrIS 1.11]